MTLTNNDNKPPMRVVRQHTWGALLIYRRIPLAKTQRNAEELPSTGSGTVNEVCCPLSVVYKKNASMLFTNINAFFSCWLLAIGLGCWPLNQRSKALAQKPKALVLINH